MKTVHFTDISRIEQNALSQLSDLERQEKVDNIAVFPDIHFCDEKGIPVGLAFATRDVIFPLTTGKDMGCGVAFRKISKELLLKPFNKEEHYNAFNREHFKMTDEGLGGGNHFLSLEEDDRNLYIIVHTGTRNRGIYMYQKNTQLLSEYGNANYFTVDFLHDKYPNWFEEYNAILAYGTARRKEFLQKSYEFLIRNKYIKEGAFEESDSIHNHIKLENGIWIHRKGATELNNDTVVIPLSMTRGSLLVKQTYNASDNLNSSSHGAGRKLSRTDTLKYWHSSLKERQRKEYMEKFKELLDRSNKFSKGYIQEFDFAYKDSSTILQEQPFLKKVTETRPICTVKFTEI
jgi:RNA-splicing ligase RtcB